MGVSCAQLNRCHTVLNQHGNRTVNSSSKAECTHSIIIFYSFGNFSSNYESFSHRARIPYCNRTTLYFINTCKYSQFE